MLLLFYLIVSSVVGMCSMFVVKFVLWNMVSFMFLTGEGGVVLIVCEVGVLRWLPFDV